MDSKPKISTFVTQTLAALLGGILSGAFWIVWFVQAEALEAMWALVAALLLGPVGIAAGATVGRLAYDRLLSKRRPTFWQLYPWPLAGCAFAGAMTWWGGPWIMLLGMLLLGAATLVLREIVLIRHSRRP